MGADQALEIRRQFDSFQLQGQRIAVRVGDQHHAFACTLDRGQEGVRIRAQGDQMSGFQFQLAHRQLQFGTPEIQAVPLQLAGIAFKQRLQFHIGHGPTHSVPFGIALWQVLQPEMVVEVQVQQRAVHVQQNGIDIAPGQQGHKNFSSGKKGIRKQQSG
ncbi:hypothetical protein D3C73_1246460 [compost metagenome]